MSVTDAYLGNPNLKKVNTPVEFTKEQVIEFQKCKDDPIYFMEKFMMKFLYHLMGGFHLEKQA